MPLKRGKVSGRGLSLGKVAELCGVTRKTILRWVKNSMLPSFILPSGHHRVLPNDIAIFLRQHGMPVPNGLTEMKRCRVLVADNDSDSRIVVSRILEKQFDVDVVCNGIETCIALGQNPPDILVLDIRMPKMNGIEVCKAIRQDAHLSMVKIIAISAYLDDESYAEISELADTVFSKPIHAGQLLAECMRLCVAANL